MDRWRTTPDNTERQAAASRAGQIMLRALILMIVLPLAFLTVPAARVNAAATGQVTILVLDMSGSMATNDPHGLRCSAADAYISLSGPNQFIGVVGLTDSADSGSGKAQVWAQPEEMQTLQARQQLIQTIASKSNNCAPNGNTPTYDALVKAYDMLAKATSGGDTGSVILLSDGAPAPNQEQQTNDIIQQLVPKFSRAGFPINTIALGDDPAVGPFLRDVSSGTNGSYDADVNPATGQTDPLEIAPVFLRYFAALTGRTPKSLVAQQPVNGGVTARNFSVTSLVKHLDVIVIKQDPAATVTLKSPEGIVYTSTTASVFVAKDPHYAIFSIDGPTQGEWIATITGGSGEFSVYGLVVTDLHIAITAPTGSRTTFPIDQPINVQALLTNGNVNVNGNYTVRGDLTSGSRVIQQVVFNHVSGSATYTATVALPSGQKPGSYTLTLNVFQGSSDVLTSSKPRVINFEIFPAPFLLDSSGKQVTSVNTTVTAYDGGLQFIYSLPVFSWFSEWPFGGPLRGIPAKPSAVINGVVTLDGKPYQNASVSGSAKQATSADDGKGSSTQGGKAASASSAATAATVSSSSEGRFRVMFPVAADGSYDLRLNTSGSYADSHNASWPTDRQVTLTIKPATVSQEVVAWLWTIVYLLILIALSPIIYRWLFPRPGYWQKTQSNRKDNGSFYRLQGRLRYWRRWFRPAVVSSGEAWGLPGLMLNWGWFGGLFGTSIRPDGPDASQWKPNRARSVFTALTYTPPKGNSVTIDITRRLRGNSRTGVGARDRGGRAGGGANSGRGGFRSGSGGASSLTGRPISSTGRSATGRPPTGFKKPR